VLETNTEPGQTDVLITTPFHPAYLTADLFAKAKKLRLCITAGVGSE
jgi:formate dehydrogenase